MTYQHYLSNQPSFFVRILLTSLIFLHHTAGHTQSSASVTKQQLNQLTGKVNALNNTINKEQTTRQSLYQTLAATEKQIGTQITELQTVKKMMTEKEHTIQQVKQTIHHHQQQLVSEQKVLAHHLRTRYHLQKAPPLQWLLHHDNLQKTDHLAHYYQYLLQADKKLIQHIQTTMQTLEQNQLTLTKESALLNQLQQTLQTRQQKLVKTKQEHNHVIQSLNHSIQTKQQMLATYQRDQARLQTLLETLSHPAIAPRQMPHTKTISSFTHFRAKFSNPLGNNANETKSLNQGMLFLAKEGTPVTTILPGKVVFSDWLNGYGLLLIIDHGQGMMSLYAHNESLSKTKGDAVRPGEQIATVGHTGGLYENGLYFELRRRGKVVPSRQWLS
jgi:septal ring factor EnvC (AmiA/AmiB activator)